jgi:hypothetical protein
VFVTSFQQNGDAVCMADKTEVGGCYPRPYGVSFTLLWACNLTNKVDSIGDRGSKALPNKQDLFVCSLVL